MSLNREEIAADLVWRYVEHLRKAQGPAPSPALNRAELEQLLEMLELAGDLPHVLTPDAAVEARKAAVLRRVERSVVASTDHVSPAAADRPAAPRRSWVTLLVGGNPVPVWKFRAALGAAMVLAVALALGIPSRGTRQQEQVVKRVRVPVQASEIGIEPVEETQVHDLLPRMVRNELPPQQERNLMWHMLVCRGCFDEYTELKHHRGQTAASRSAMLAVLRK